MGALAQGTASQRSHCEEDAYRLCGPVIPNVRKIEACLESKLDQLTPACRSEFDPPKKPKPRR